MAGHKPNKIKTAFKKLPVISRIISQRDNALERLELLKAERNKLVGERNAVQSELANLKKAQGFVPPGHFYSPVPCLDDIKRDEGRIFDDIPRSLPGITFDDKAQLALLKQFSAYYRELPFQSKKQPGLRYFYENPGYSQARAGCGA
jgi:hypothetical protein